MFRVAALDAILLTYIHFAFVLIIITIKNKLDCLVCFRIEIWLLIVLLNFAWLLIDRLVVIAELNADQRWVSAWVPRFHFVNLLLFSTATYSKTICIVNNRSKKCKHVRMFFFSLVFSSHSSAGKCILASSLCVKSVSFLETLCWNEKNWLFSILNSFSNSFA